MMFYLYVLWLIRWRCGQLFLYTVNTPADTYNMLIYACHVIIVLIIQPLTLKHAPFYQPYNSHGAQAHQSHKNAYHRKGCHYAASTF
jgi:hypothetical protein